MGAHQWWEFDSSLRRRRRREAAVTVSDPVERVMLHLVPGLRTRTLCEFGTTPAKGKRPLIGKSSRLGKPDFRLQQWLLQDPFCKQTPRNCNSGYGTLESLEATRKFISVVSGLRLPVMYLFSSDRSPT